MCLRASGRGHPPFEHVIHKVSDIDDVDCGVTIDASLETTRGYFASQEEILNEESQVDNID